MNEFQTVKKFLVLTEIGLKRFNKRSFKSGEVKRSISSGKDREFGVTVLAGTGRVFQKMLSNSRVMGGDLRSPVVFLAGTGKIGAILRRMMVSGRPRNVLFNAFLQPLECTSYVPTVSAAHKLTVSALHRAKRISVYILAGKGGFCIHRCDKSSFVFLI